MKNPITHIASLVGIISLSSCEGIVGGNGYVYDSRTKTPIENVKVVLFLNDKASDTCYSDSKGFFRGSEFVGCVPDCPCAKIVMTKDSFKTLTIDFEEYWKKNKNKPLLHDSMTLYLDRIK